MVFNGCMKLYFMGMLEFNYYFFIEYIFIFSLSSMHCGAMKNLIGKAFFAGAIYYVLRIVSCKRNNKVGGV